jgi:hypothetical protein
MKPSILSVTAGIAAYALGVALPSYAGNACEVKSGAATAALVELYTSEGCSSCPPADRQLNRLQQQLQKQAGTHAVAVPLALHVTYWNDLGWKDGLSQKIFDARQDALVAHRNSATAQTKASGIVYTPQFFVNGAELRGWRDGLPQAIRDINARPAPVTITLKSKAVADDRIMLDAEVAPVGNVSGNADKSQLDGALYLAISESGLVSQIGSGENSGVTLRHDDAARAWFGPLQLKNGRAHLQQTLAIPSTWNRRHLQAVAFVQERQDGRILQAVSTQQCTQTKGL